MKKIKSILIIIFSISIIFSIFNIGKVLASVNTIKITNVQIKEKSTGVDASIVSYDNDDVKANVEYHKVNDYVIFNVTLKNSDTKKYTIKTITDDNLNGNIVYEYDKHENEEFNSNEEKVLEIKSTYKTEVNNMDKRVVNNSVKFNIIFVDEDGNESSKVIPINPKTGDNIGIYLLILIVSLIGLLSITIQKNKKIRSSLLIALLLIPITAQAANLNFIISFNENIKLYDKLLVKINGEEKIIPYNSKIDKPENPSKPGYTFDNWYSGNEVFDFTKEIKEDTTITPKFNIITYNINYDYAGGTATNPTTYTVEDKITLNNPTKAGYTFAGWTGTGITTQTTSVTIQKGSTEDRSYVAHFSTNQNTKYTVVHKYQKLDSTQYETEEVEEHGATDTEVAAPRKPKAGFETPEEQNVTITGDGKAKVTYVYNRETYTLNVTNRTYLDETSTANDTYPYETQITLKAQEREGYTFKWNDNDTNYTKSFKLTENKELTPIYTANQNTKYTVVHKYQKLDPTQYETEEVEEHGTTDETVPAPRKPKAGFETPEEQNVTITGDGKAKVTYVYNRKTYTLNVTDRTYLDSTSTANGTYPYETQITLKAQERAGYTFKWSDDDTSYEKTFKLTEEKELTLVYTPNDDTKYTVVHKYQKLDLTQYETEEVEEHGTTDETVPASRKPKTGFETPEEQNVKITGDGEARVTYVYNRKTYTFTINDSEYVNSTKESGNYPYETQITISPKERAGFTFTKWSDNTTDNPKTITLTSNVTISPVYEANELDFNGDETISKIYSTSSQNVTINPASNGSGNYTYTITEGNTNNYFSISEATLTIKENTPVSEYTIKIKAKDNVTNAEKTATFKITITKQQSDAVTNLNVSPEGIVSFTNSANADGYLISIDGINYTPVLPGSETTTYNYLTQVTAVSGTRTVFVKAINSDSGNYDESDPVSKDVTVYKLSINVSDDTLGEVSQSSINVINGATYASSENKLTLSDERKITTSKKTITGYTITFDGWSLENGTISQDTTITANYSKTINKYTVTFDTDGGSEVSSQTIEHGSKVTKPTDPTKTDYTFDNWYTTDSFETIFDFENTTITKDTTIYAKFDVIDKCKTFSTDSWSTISTNLASNSSYYGVGCEKEVELDMDEDSTPESYTVRLANTSKPEVCNTPGYSQTACGTVIEFVDLVSKRGMNSTSTIAGGWKESEMVTYINSDFYNKLPNDLKEVIIPTYPIVSGSGSDKVSNDITKEDNNINKLYLLSAREAGFNLDNDNKKNVLTDTRTLDYYVGTSETIPDDKRSKSDLSGNHQYWWLRTPNSSFTKYCFSVNTGGAYANQYCYSNFGVAPAFRIGTPSVSNYTVTFDTDGGSEISDIKVDAGDSINELPTPTKDGSIFLGWFENVTDENPVTAPYTPSGDIELIAKWQKMICKKATTLNTEICNSPSGKGCRVNGHSIGDTISYGNVITSDSLVPGDALDCDVDGTGYNQRFYYVTDNGDNAVLISYTTFSGDLGQSNINVYYNYDTSLTLLPTTTQWSNLPVKFEIQSGDYRPARMIKLSELEAMTGKTYSELQTDGALNDYEFLYENSLYSGVGERSTVWLEQTTIGGTDTRIRYRNDTRKLDVVSSDKYNSSNNCIKPIIEVPYNLIEDSYIIRFNPNGGIVSNKYANIQKGEKIGTLPTATRNDYIFTGWYTSLDFTIPVNENTIPNGYVTYYAKWVKPVEEAQLEHDSFNLNIDESKTINVLNNHELENYTFTSSNSEVASVTNEGVITGVSVGEATITMRGTVSDTTKEIHVNVQQEGTTYNVEFDSQGGEKVESINVDKNTAIGILPVTTKENKLFVGWYTSLEYTEKVAETTIIDSDKKYYARWADADDVAEMNNEFYKSIQTAVNTAPTTKTTITLLQDVSINAFINMFDKNTNKDIVLDLNNHTLTGTEGQTIKTKIPLEIKNGTVVQTSANGTIDLGPGGHLIINSGRIENSGGKAAIYNDGGIVEIGGDVYLTSNAEFASNNKRGTVQNKSGTTIITGGTIVNTRSSSSYAVAVSNGTFTLGTQDGIYNTSSITLQGNTSGIYSDVNYSVYDGVIKGKGSAVNLESKITSTEANSTKINTEEEIESVTYKVLYYNIELSKYEITLNPDGGEVNPTLILVDQGNKVGTLPTPSKGIYTFDGWYNESNEAVDENTVPTKNETYTAKWVYDVNPNVVSFRTTPDAQKTYYQYIDTWKNSSSNFPSWSSSNNGPNWPLDATENTVMMQNFNNNNCMCADNQCSSTGTVHCDKPKGYNTGVNGKVSVYTYNETSGEKDTKVTYAKGDNGVIYNLIPDKVYYWELDSDEDVHGLVKFTSERRIIDAGDVLNVRDLGGLPADTDGDNIPDATLAYGRLFRGIKLNSSSSIAELTNLGINSELDLREANSDAYKISRYNRIEAQNYFVNPNGETTEEKGYYTMTRNAVKYAMEEIVAGNNLYYHCRIGTDRTGTVSYVLEGLLGVPEEDRVQDYELSFFYGLVRIHRYHNEKPGSNVGTGKERFVYMHDFMPTNSDIYNWYMQGTTNQTEDEKLIEDFRNAMIEK